MPRSPLLGRRRFLLAVGGATLLAVSTVPAAAQTPEDPVARLADLDAAAATLADEIGAAQAELAARRAELSSATAAADRAGASATAARARAEVVRTQVDDLVAASYSGARTSRLSALLVAQSPQELLDRMSVLDLLGADSARALQEATTAATAAEQAESAAAAAQDAAVAAERRAVVVQAGLVQRRKDLGVQTAEANALLASLTASASVSSVQLAPSVRASTLRASRATGIRDALFIVPAEGRFTSGYGPRGGSPHNGIDLANSIGTPIVSTADGVVVDSGPASGFGLWVRVRHADGTVTTYGHNDANTVAVGQQVAAGEQIATIGNRGQSTGPHVHFEVSPPGGGTVDPQAWLAERGVVVG